MNEPIYARVELAGWANYNAGSFLPKDGRSASMLEAVRANPEWEEVWRVYPAVSGNTQEEPAE